jgi:hypothetical protein
MHLRQPSVPDWGLTSSTYQRDGFVFVVMLVVLFFGGWIALFWATCSPKVSRQLVVVDMDTHNDAPLVCPVAFPLTPSALVQLHQDPESSDDEDDSDEDEDVTRETKSGASAAIFRPSAAINGQSLLERFKLVVSIALRVASLLKAPMTAYCVT